MKLLKNMTSSKASCRRWQCSKAKTMTLGKSDRVSGHRSPPLKNQHVTLMYGLPHPQKTPMCGQARPMPHRPSLDVSGPFVAPRSPKLRRIRAGGLQGRQLRQVARKASQLTVKQLRPRSRLRPQRRVERSTRPLRRSHPGLRRKKKRTATRRLAQFTHFLSR